MGSFQQMIWNPLAEAINPSLIDGQLALMSGYIKEDKFRPGDMQLNVSTVMPINAVSGFPVNSFYAEDIPTANRILTLLGGVASSISDKMLNHGHAVLLKGNVYVKPEQVAELRRCGRAHYMLAL